MACNRQFLKPLFNLPNTYTIQTAFKWYTSYYILYAPCHTVLNSIVPLPVVIIEPTIIIKYILTYYCILYNVYGARNVWAFPVVIPRYRKMTFRSRHNGWLCKCVNHVIPQRHAHCLCVFVLFWGPPSPSKQIDGLKISFPACRQDEKIQQQYSTISIRHLRHDTRGKNSK